MPRRLSRLPTTLASGLGGETQEGDRASLAVFADLHFGTDTGGTSGLAGTGRDQTRGFQSQQFRIARTRANKIDRHSGSPSSFFAYPRGV